MADQPALSRLDEALASAQHLRNLVEALPHFEELQLIEVQVRSNEVRKLREAATETVQRLLSARQSETSATQREGFYEKLWKDFVSIQRGDAVGICEKVERYYREQEAHANDKRERSFPVIYWQSKNSKPGPMTIPWEVAEYAYSVYSSRYGRSQSLERLSERGGFHASELDDFLPDWRERASIITDLRAQLASCQSATSVPHGWKLVPVEPTQEMLNALEDIDTPFIAGAEKMTWQEYQRLRWQQIIDRTPVTPADSEPKP